MFRELGQRPKPNVILNICMLFQPHFTGALICSDGLSVSAETRNQRVYLHYSEPFIHQLPRPSCEYKVEDWTDYNKVKMLETSLASQIIKTYSTFSKENRQWIWPIIMIITTLLCISFVAIVVCF